MEEHALVVQHAGIVHVVGALPAAHQIFQLLGRSQPLGPAAGLRCRVHLSDQRIKIVAALGESRSGQQAMTRNATNKRARFMRKSRHARQMAIRGRYGQAPHLSTAGKCAGLGMNEAGKPLE